MISSVIDEAWTETIDSICISLGISVDFLSPPLSLSGYNAQFANVREVFTEIYGGIPSYHRNIVNSGLLLVIYANYEAYVHELMEAFISETASYCNKYSELPQALRGFHLQVLADRLGKTKNSADDSVRDIVSIIDQLKLHESDLSPKSIDASIAREMHNNFRFGELNRCLKRIGAPGFAKFVTQSERLKNHIGSDNISHDDLKTRLDEFVVARNEIIHSHDIDRALGVDWITTKVSLIKIIFIETNAFLGQTLEKYIEDLEED